MASGVKTLKGGLCPSRPLIKIPPTAVARLKLAKLLSEERFNKTVNWTSLVRMAAAEEIIVLNIPESLIRSPSDLAILFTDTSGVLRLRSGDRVKEQFTLLCTALRKKVHNLHPQGLRFPKYVTFGRSGAEFTIKHKRDLQQYLENPEAKVQRFIIPANFQIRKTVILWRRTKVLKKFSVSSRLPLKQRMLAAGLKLLLNVSPQLDQSKFILDLPYIASLRSLETCDVRLEPRLSDSEESTLSTVKSLLEKYVLSDSEQLEEFAISTVDSQDGRCYVLNCSKVKTTAKDVHFCPMSGSLTCRRSSLPRVEELANRILKSNSFTKKLEIPKLILADQPSNILQALVTYRRASLPIPAPTDSIISEHISSAAGNLDKLCQLTKERKHASAMREMVRFQGYPHDFLPKVIHEMYSRIIEQPKLARYFKREEQAMNHLEGSIHQVFIQGRYPSKVREIHRKLDISETDFALYLREFERTFTKEGSFPEDTQKAIAYLASFKNCVVTKRRGSIEDLGIDDEI